MAIPAAAAASTRVRKGGAGNRQPEIVIVPGRHATLAAARPEDCNSP
jgi:hypothetical protein